VSLRTERTAEIGQAHPEILEGLGLRAVGPEESGEPTAFGRVAGAQGKESEEPLSFSGAQMGERLAVDPRLEDPEKADLQRCRCGMRAGIVSQN
jgi:hypothetical protein